MANDDELARPHGRSKVLLDDINYLVARVEQHTLSSISECYELQHEIHELQAILADWDSYVGIEVARKVAQQALREWSPPMKTKPGH